MTEPFSYPRNNKTFFWVWIGIMVFILLATVGYLAWGKTTLQPTSTPLFKGDYILLEGTFAGNLVFFQIESTGEKAGVLVGQRIPVSLKISLARPSPTDGRLP